MIINNKTKHNNLLLIQQFNILFFIKQIIKFTPRFILFLDEFSLSFIISLKNYLFIVNIFFSEHIFIFNI
jgi:hypothetical protein